MAKRRTGKPSRGDRRGQRERSDRARQHGLPARDVERPVRRESIPSTPSTRPRRLRDQERDSDAPARSSRPAQRAGALTWIRQRAGWIAVGAGVLLVVVAMIASRAGSPAPETPASPAPAPSARREQALLQASPSAEQPPVAPGLEAAPTLSGFLRPPPRESPLPGPAEPSRAPTPIAPTAAVSPATPRLAPTTVGSAAPVLPSRPVAPVTAPAAAPAPAPGSPGENPY